MKKTLWRCLLAAIFLSVILFTPIPAGRYKDGGTREFRALTYKIVDWNRLGTEEIYDVTKVYWLPDNFKSVDELWHMEEQHIEHRFVATVLQLGDGYALVEPVEGVPERMSCDKISISTAGLADIGAEVGSNVEITYTGMIMETYPARVHAINWQPAN